MDKSLLVNKMKKVSLLMLVISVGFISACEQVKETAENTAALDRKVGDSDTEKVTNEKLASVDEILSQVYHCNETIIIR